MLNRSLKAICVLATIAFAGVMARPAEAREELCDSSYQNCRTALITLIQNETQEIDVGTWFWEDARYSNAIIAQKQQYPNLIVRVLMDTRAMDPSANSPGTKTVMDQLKAAGIPMRTRTAGGIEHWKAMIFGGQRQVYFGSANFTSEAFVYNQQYVNYIDETVYYTDDPMVVNSFMTKFDNAWVDTTNYANYANVTSLQRSYSNVCCTIDPELNFVPDQNYANRAVNQYGLENSKMDVSMFRITDRRHTDAVITAMNRGVTLRLLVDPGQYRAPNRLWDAWNVDRLYVAGQQTGRGTVRVSVHQGENHGKLVLLYGLGETIFGSSNWSSPSGDDQHEHNYFTKKANIFNWFVTYFERRWNNSNPLGVKETDVFTPLPPDAPVYKSPANGAVGVPLTGQKLVWDGGPWAHVYDIYWGKTSPPPLYLKDQPLGPDDDYQYHTHLQSITLPTLDPGVTYYWQIVSKTMANQTATPKINPVWSFTTSGSPTPLPSPWSQSDIGSVAIPGSASYSNGTFTVTGSGADIWGSADAFHYVYQSLSGDGSMQMRVAGVSNTNSWSKSGVMIRETLSANSKQAIALVSAAKGVAFQRRTTTGGSSVSTAGSASSPPRWVKLTRSGNLFTASESGDGSSWTTIGSDTISMASTVYIGIAVTSHSTSASATATVDNVSLGGAPPPPPPPSGASTYVMYMSHVPAGNIHGAWQLLSDPNASDGAALWNPDAGASKIAPALANPANYFEQTFTAVAGTPYHLWVRMRAQGDSYLNDSIHVQFCCDSVDSGGSAYARIGTSSSAEVVLQDGATGTIGQGWGWTDNGWGSLGADVYFTTSGTHTIRVQQREDGAIVDEIVLSPDTYLSSSPGQRRNDTNILSSTDGGTSAEALPSPWTQTDVGAVTIAGSASHSAGTMTVRASGADIWGTADAFHFVYKTLTGDASIVARIASLQNVNSWSKAGVMIRETLDAGSKHAMMLASAAKGMAFQRRETTGGTSVNTAGSTSAPPAWVRLDRAGDTFTAYESQDGAAWTEVGTDDIAMASSVYVGLAVTSHSTSASTTAAIDNITSS